MSRKPTTQVADTPASTNVVSKLFASVNLENEVAANQNLLVENYRLRSGGTAAAEDATRRLARMPSRDQLQTREKAFSDALVKRADERQIRFIIATMLEAIPAAASQVTAAYIDAMVWSIEHADDDRDPTDRMLPPRGFSPHVLVGAVREIWMQSRFAPSIAEFVGTARAVRERYYHAWITVRRHLILIDNAERIIAKAPKGLSVDKEHIPF